MRYSLIFSTLAGLAVAIPQKIDIAGVDAAPDPVFVAAPLDVISDQPSPAPTKPVEPITSKVSKRGLQVQRRDGNCAPQQPGPGPVPTPDTPAAFTAYADFKATSDNAPNPAGYTRVFSSKNGSLSASKFMGLTTLDSYDVLTCASRCDKANGCQAFNVYIERDPTLDPNAQDCPNPPSTTNYKCTLWGAPVAASQATNKGQWRNSFNVVIAGSNGYNKDIPPPPISGYTGPTALGGAINAPLDSQGHSTYMGYQYFPFSQSQGYDPSTCASACNVQTTYNRNHPNSDGSYQTCVFFNAYVLYQNTVPQGLYCPLYNQTWAPSYATNYGQIRGDDHFTVGRSYSYSLTNPPSTTPP